MIMERASVIDPQQTPAKVSAARGLSKGHHPSDEAREADGETKGLDGRTLFTPLTLKQK